MRERLAREERRQVLGHRGIARVRQADLGQRGARSRRGARRRRDDRKEPFDDRARHFVAREIDPKRAPHQARAAPRDRDRDALGGVAAEEPLFRRAARVNERRHLPFVDRLPRVVELLLREIREREVHVVAAEQDVIADRDPFELELSVFLDGGDCGKVGRPAADVRDQDDVARVEITPPRVAARIDPGVERRLRLFEERERFDPGRERRFDGELARPLRRTTPEPSGSPLATRAEHRGARRPTLRRGARGSATTPRRARSSRRRPARRAEGCRSVDRASGGRASSSRSRRHAPRIGAARPARAHRRRTFDSHPTAALGPFARIREVEKRRQERLVFDRPGRDELRDAEHVDARVRIARVGVGERRVRRTENRCRRRSGRSQLDLRGRHDRRVVPRDGGRERELLHAPAAMTERAVYGGSPRTSPTSRFSAAEKPRARVTLDPSSSPRTGASSARARSALRHPSWTTRAAEATSASENGAMSCSRKSMRRPSR